MRLALSLSFIFVCAVVAVAQTAPLPSEFQSWNEVQLLAAILHGKDAKGKKIDKSVATFSGILRIGRSNLDFLDNRASVTVDYRLNRHLLVFGSVLYRKDELVRNVRRFETRLAFGATPFATWRGITFRDRNQFEHRFRNGRADINLYRNRFQASHSIRFSDKEIFTPFISEEGYYDLTNRLWIQNEFYAGITRRLNKRTSIDIAYLRLDQRPTNVNGLSLNLKIKLR